jgi:hypothetical protein
MALGHTVNREIRQERTYLPLFSQTGKTGQYALACIFFNIGPNEIRQTPLVEWASFNLSKSLKDRPFRHRISSGNKETLHNSISYQVTDVNRGRVGMAFAQAVNDEQQPPSVPHLLDHVLCGLSAVHSKSPGNMLHQVATPVFVDKHQQQGP